MSKALAYLAVALAAVGYGSYFVPVKKYDIHDGVVYQWFMCCGIMLGALVVACLRNNWSTEGMSSSAFYVTPLGLLSGLIWTISNVLAARSVRYFGLGNYYLWHELTNLAGTFVVGVLGPRIGIPAKTPSNVVLAGLGFVCVFVGMIPVTFMKSEEALEDEPSTGADREVAQAAVVRSTSSQANLEHLFVHQESDETPKSNRSSQEVIAASGLAEGSSAISSSRSFLEAGMQSARSQRQEVRGGQSRADANALTWDGTVGRPDLSRHLSRLRFPKSQHFDTFGSFGAFAIMSEDGDSVASPTACEEPTAGGTARGRSGLSSWMKGWLLALVVGCILSVQYEPMLPWQHDLEKLGFKVTGLDYVFSTCLGIFLCSTAYLLAAGGYKRITRQPMLKPVLRPALLAGFTWTMSCNCQLYAMTELPYAVAYCVVVGGGLAVSLLWGIFKFEEATTRHNKTCLAVAFAGIWTGILVLGSAA